MRLLRWADRLKEYDFQVYYRPGWKNVANLLSRSSEASTPKVSHSEASSNSSTEVSKRSRMDSVNSISSEDSSVSFYSTYDSITDSEDELMIATVFGNPALTTISRDKLAEATRSDSILIQVHNYISSHWPPRKALHPDLWPFYTVRAELSSIDGIVFRGERAVIPEALRAEVIKLSHEGHLGMVKMKQRARESTWWPGMDHDIEEHVRHCEPCQLSDKSVHPEVPRMQPIRRPEVPWSRVSIDIKGELHGAPANARFLLVAYDLHSKWPEVRHVSLISSEVIIKWLLH